MLEPTAAVLDGVSLTIPRGARIGIAGRTGSGKSTLMDIVIGLLEPTDGEIRVDGVALTADNRRAWQRNIAHVPQAIFLSDASIAENIAFGVRAAEIDLERARRAAEQAELGEVIAALPNGYATLVGERGIRLSGGQRQRIGIARALYKRASVLVLRRSYERARQRNRGSGHAVRQPPRPQLNSAYHCPPPIDVAGVRSDHPAGRWESGSSIRR